MSWTDERTEKARKLWIDGRSAKEIAKALGGDVSRNAVIGRLHRIGVAGPNATARRLATPPNTNKAAGGACEGRKAYTPRPRTPKAPKPARKGPSYAIGGLKAPKAERKPPQASPPPAETIALAPRHWETRRTFKECAYPVSGEGAETLSCCNPTGGKTYCPDHHRRMHSDVFGSWAQFSTPAFAGKVA